MKQFPDADAEAPRDAQTDANDSACEPDATALCYTGPPETEDASACHGGVQTCDAVGNWGPCVGEVTPEIQCQGRECGPDGCGGSCGTCEFGVDCADATGICLRDEMVLVIGGSFNIGSPDTEHGDAEDEPSTEISVDDFYIDRTEVTNQAYLRCVLDHACESPDTCSSGVPVWTGPISFPDDMAHHPVTCIDWEMAQYYCAWAGKRLCTEAEWERACINNVHRVYPWGDTWPMDPDHYVNCNEWWCHDGFEETAAVGSFPVYGATPETHIMDMAGNVSEWVLDYYEPHYYGTKVDNPQGPCDGVSPCGGRSVRVHRGGSFYTEKDFLRCSKRGQQAQDSRPPTTGVRCCKDYTP